MSQSSISGSKAFELFAYLLVSEHALADNRIYQQTLIFLCVRHRIVLTKEQQEELIQWALKIEVEE